MVAEVSTAINPKTENRRVHSHNPTRPPLLPSEPDNALVPPTRRAKAREVVSRYMSSSSNPSAISRRGHSPLSRTVNSTSMMTPTPAVPSLTKRSQSAERRRPVTPLPNSLYSGGSNTPTAQKMLFTSTRTLSVSFQGESFSIQVSKTKPTPASNVRKSTPERRKATTPARGGIGSSNHSDNSRLVDHQRWPGRVRQSNGKTRSLDCEEWRRKLGGPVKVVKSLQNLMVDVQASFEGTMSSERGNRQAKNHVESAIDKDKAIGSELQGETEAIASDNESVSSNSSSGAQYYVGGGAEQGQRGSRAIVVPGRFLQETSSGLQRQKEPCFLSSTNSGNVAMAPPKQIATKTLWFDSPIPSPRGVVNSRGQQSPVRVRPSSPSKLSAPSVSSSSLRGVSPSRVRNGLAGAPNSSLSNTPSILSFVVDLKRGKIGENRIVDAHLLRLVYNRLLQWRFVNARANAALSVQRLNAEKSLYDAWTAISELSESVRVKRADLQLLKLHVKMFSVLSEQMIYLEDWAILDRGYSSSLSGATEALKASTLRLPVGGGAKADLLDVKDAICSAMDVMQAMASSIRFLLPKVGNVNSLVMDVVNLSEKERALLNESKDLLSRVAAMQITECSLRTHISQIKCLSHKPNDESSTRITPLSDVQC